MDTLNTKQACSQVGVSQTTIKRWASHFPSSFPKDENGHYVFTSVELDCLAQIKRQTERGIPLSLVTISSATANGAEPAQSVLPDHLSSQELPIDLSDVLSRISEVERSVGQKADEVLSVQVLEHRRELEELRRMIAQVAATVEKLSDPQPQALVWPQAGQQAAHKEKPSSPARRRGFFGLF